MAKTKKISKAKRKYTRKTLKLPRIVRASFPTDRDKLKQVMHGLTYGLSANSAIESISSHLKGKPMPLGEAAIEEACVNVASQPAWRNATDIEAGRKSATEMLQSNPKTLVGQAKVPMLSVVSPTSLIYEALAMRYGAFWAPRKDGTKGYGPYNWRDQPIEAMIYIDAAIRHCLQYLDGEEWEEVIDSDGNVQLVPVLGLAKASIGILADAIENDTVIDNRPKVRSKVATRLLHRFKVTTK